MTTNYEKVKAALDGRLSYNDLTTSQQSMIRLPIYHISVRVLSLPKEYRLQEINNQPESLQNLIKQEIIRINDIRNKK